jgi:SAM-dependent methyltransferase
VLSFERRLPGDSTWLLCARFVRTFLLPLADYILRSLLDRTRPYLAKLAPKAGRHSTWSDYMAANLNYSTRQFAAKQSFVSEALAEYTPKPVLDAGCSTGHFSVIAAQMGASAVSIDYDPVVQGDGWRKVQAEKLDISASDCDSGSARPGPGWNNREWPSLLDRARCRFDAVLMLAVLHHMLVTERVPLHDIVRLAAGLTNDEFAAACRPHFEIVRSHHADGATRWLYAPLYALPYALRMRH